MRAYQTSLIAFVGIAALAFPPAFGQSSPSDAHSLCLPTGPPPTDGYQPRDGARVNRGEKVIGGVPAYLWRHGCGPTAAGMLIGYWDGNGFPALIPGDATTQTDAVNQAIASGNGPNTHYSDYSQPIDNANHDPHPLPDLSEPPPGDEHTSHCLGDFMRTSWSAARLYYGWSWYGDMDNALPAYTLYAAATYDANYEAVSWNERWGTFTWDKFVAEIDADRPLVFLVDTNGNGTTDHFVAVIGYRDTNGYPEYACLDTWSNQGYRWERFRELASGNDWGIYGATYFSIFEGCAADLDGDWDTDQSDLGILLADWGCIGENCPGDIDNDGDTDQADLAILLTDWGCTATP